MGTTTLLTFEEFERLPDSPGKHELLDGELIEMPPAKARHSKIQHRIHGDLSPYVLERGLGDVYIEAGFKLGERHWVQPDVSLVSTRQSHASEPDGYFEDAPRLAIGVISEANTAESVDRKIARYFEHGCEEVWVFYPKTRRTWVYRRNDPAAMEHREMAYFGIVSRMETRPLQSVCLNRSRRWDDIDRVAKSGSRGTRADRGSAPQD